MVECEYELTREVAPLTSVLIDTWWNVNEGACGKDWNHSEF